MPGDPTQTIFHWQALGVCVGGNANFMFRVGGNANFSVFRYQHVGNPTLDSRVHLGTFECAISQRNT